MIAQPELSFKQYPSHATLEPPNAAESSLCAWVVETKPNEVGGVNIYAGAAIDGRDRRRLKRLCRYVAWPSISQNRLEVIGDGRVTYGFRHARRDGTYGVLLDPSRRLALPKPSLV